MKKQYLIADWTAKFLRSLRERNASAHTIKAYTGDLAAFAEYVGSRGLREIDHVTIRGFLSQLYEKGLSKTSVARALAAVRSLYRWLAQEGAVEQNPAALVSTPKLPKKLPRVPTMEEMNSREIARVLGIPEGTVRTRLQRARQLLRGKMEAKLTPNKEIRSV